MTSAIRIDASSLPSPARILIPGPPAGPRGSVDIEISYLGHDNRAFVRVGVQFWSLRRYAQLPRDDDLAVFSLDGRDRAAVRGRDAGRGALAAGDAAFDFRRHTG